MDQNLRIILTQISNANWLPFTALASQGKPATAEFRPIRKSRALTLVLITNNGLKFSELFLQKGPITKTAKMLVVLEEFFHILNQVIWMLLSPVQCINKCTLRFKDLLQSLKQGKTKRLSPKIPDYQFRQTVLARPKMQFQRRHNTVFMAGSSK